MDRQPSKCSRFVREFVLFLLIFSSVSAWIPKRCSGKMIWSSAKELEKLRGCDVIEGNLVISRIQEPEQNWITSGNLTIKEITGYLIFYDILNLRSLDVILPQLSVIRGESLFRGEYALIISLLSDLEEVNLSRLTNILLGSVFIYANSALSYLSTVNFDLIVKSKLHKNLIQMDKKKPCSKNCTAGFCWTSNKCQNTCSNCVIDTDVGLIKENICHEQCIGGCYKPHVSTSCIACKNFREQQICLSECKENYYEWDGYKCVTDIECKTKNRLIFGKKCIKNCPWNYQPVNLHIADAIPTCFKRLVPIPCEGGMVSSLQTSKRFHGCRNISGSLKISLSGSAVDTIDEINKNLGEIEEIGGFLYIFRSMVRSLKFLNNLQVIQGNELLHNKYSFVVSDCKNLQSLWEKKKNLSVKEGKIQFYRNPKLCPETIKDLIGNTAYSEQFLPKEEYGKYILNGFKVSCQKEKIDVMTESLNKKGVIRLTLPKVETDAKDIKNLIGYNIYYKEAPENITFRGKQDIDDSWIHQFLAYDNEAGPLLSKEIEKLNPATRYAFFVITETVPSAVSYQTGIFYESTKPYDPSSPTRMIFKKNGKSITVSWSKPNDPYVNTDFYQVTIIPKPNTVPSPTKLYCNNAVVNSEESLTQENQVEHSTEMNQNSELSPNPENKAWKIEIEQLQIDLTKFIYYNITSSDVRKYKRSLSQYIGGNGTSESVFDPITGRDERHPDIFGLGSARINNNLTPNQKKYGIGKYPSFPPRINNTKNNKPEIFKEEFLITNEPTIEETPKDLSISCTDILAPGKEIRETEFTIGNFTNFLYRIKVRACYNMTGNERSGLLSVNSKDNCWLCSAPLQRDLCIVYPGVNISVQNVQTKLLNSSAVLVQWEPPNLPIKAEEVLSYNILLSRNSTDIQYSTINSYCASSTDREKILVINYPGTYSVRVSAELCCDVGTRTLSEKIYIDVPYNHNRNVYIPITIGFSFLFIFIGFIIWRMYKMDDMKNSEFRKSYIYRATMPRCNYYIEKADLPSEIIHCEQNLKLSGLKLGEGNFGVVERGLLRTKYGTIEVAAKKLKEVGKSSSELCKMLIEETKIMLPLQSYYLVQMYGLVPCRVGLYLVMELMSKGDLSRFLERRRLKHYEKTPHGSEDHLLRIAIQIADGMFYLKENKIIHRDLAARNCLLDANYNAKVSDFGISRNLKEGIYIKIGYEDLPLNRMPPEYFNRREFSYESDVWCYGILLWELSIKNTSSPYEDLRSNAEMEQKIGQGLTLSVPPSTPLYFSTIMNQCWKKEPKERPCFKDIFNMLLAHSSQINMLEEFKTKSYIYCGDLTEKQGYIEMSSNNDKTDAQSDDAEENVETPLTWDPSHDCNSAEKPNEHHREHATYTWIQKAHARMLLIKNSNFISKIFPFTLGSMSECSLKKNSPKKGSFRV